MYLCTVALFFIVVFNVLSLLKVTNSKTSNPCRTLQVIVIVI